MSGGYRFHLTCPRDGHPVEHKATGTTDGYSTRAVAFCPSCRDDWLIEVVIRSQARARQADRLGGDHIPAGSAK